MKRIDSQQSGQCFKNKAKFTEAKADLSRYTKLIKPKAGLVSKT